MCSTLSQGRSPAATSGMPISAAARAAAPDLSPVSMRQRIPRAARAASTGLLSVRTSSRSRTCRCVEPSETQTSLPSPSPSAEAAGSGAPTKVRLPIRHSRPPTVPRRPSPATLSNASGSAPVAPRDAHQPATERESGWEEAAPRDAAAASASRSPEAGSQRWPTTAGSPRVSVPVLSKQMASTSARRSTAAPPRKRTPRRAPAAMAASTAEGMERTRAQGLITTRSVIAR